MQGIKSFGILQFLRYGPEEFSFICRIEFEDQTSRIEDLIYDEILELQMLDHQKEEGEAYTCFIKSTPCPSGRA
jgi:hypothetical protein